MFLRSGWKISSQMCSRERKIEMLKIALCVAAVLLLLLVGYVFAVGSMIPSDRVLSKQMSAEHAQIIDLLQDAAEQRGEMAKQLNYIYNAVKAARERPDVGQLPEK